MFRSKRLFFESVATLTGTIIGAGILGLPYVFSKSGYIISFFWMIFSYIIVLIINLMLAEMTLRTYEKHQISGYVEKFLGKYGKIGKYIIISSMIFEIYGAILAYLVAQSNAIYNLIGIGKLYIATIITIFAFIAIWFNIKSVEYLEAIFSIIVYSLLIFCPLYLLFTHSIYLNKLFSIRTQYLFFPLGPIFFAFLGSVAIPEVREELEGNEKLIKKTILVGMTIPLILYLFFVTSICLTFENVPAVATFLFGSFGYILSVIITLCPLLTNSFALKEMFMYDLKLPEKISQFLVFIPPYFILILFDAKVSLFIKALSIVGAISMLTFFIPIIFAHKNSKKFGERYPEFEIKIPKVLRVIIVLFLIFISINTIYLYLR